MTRRDLPGVDLELATNSHLDADKDLAWKISTEGLAKRLEERSLKLVEVGKMLRVVDANP